MIYKIYVLEAKIDGVYRAIYASVDKNDVIEKTETWVSAAIGEYKVNGNGYFEPHALGGYEAIAIISEMTDERFLQAMDYAERHKG